VQCTSRQALVPKFCHLKHQCVLRTKLQRRNIANYQNTSSAEMGLQLIDYSFRRGLVDNAA
jgi:hypothetical protein